MPTRQKLDAICSDIPMYFADEEDHKALVNTLALVNAGIMTEDGTVLRREVCGGEIVFGYDGTPTGFLKEQEGTYTRSFLDNDNLFSVDLAKTTLLDTGDMHFVLGLSYELESRIYIDKSLEKSLEVQKYSSEHVKNNWVKLFMDGKASPT